MSCVGAVDGTIDLTVGGGTAPYSFGWMAMPGTPPFDSAQGANEDLTALAAGSYGVMVTDSLGAVDSLLVTLTGPSVLSSSLFSPGYNGFNVSCNGGADGQITLTANGGVAPYMYQWSTGDTVPNIAGLAAGGYGSVVADANGCVDSAYIMLTEPVALATSLSVPVSASGLELTCSGDASGSIDLSVTDGVAPYIYNWNSGAITEDVSGIGAGWHSVRVEDANGCVRFDSTELREPLPLTYIGVPLEYQSGEFFSCDTCNDGQVTITPSGGTAPYTYLWSDGQTTAMATGLAPETMYVFSIADAAGCMVVDSAMFPANATTAPLDVFGTMSSYPGGYNVSATGAMDGDITVTIIGGTPPYSIVWLHGDSTTYVSGLAAGYYEVMVTDEQNVLSIVNFTLIEPQNGLSVQLTGGYSSCSGVGTVSAMVNGGTPPYTYQWHDTNGEIGAEVWEMLSISATGTYGVWVKDANSDSLYTDMAVQEALGFAPQVSSPQLYGTANASCAGNDGSIVVNMGGNGVPPFTVEVTGTTTNASEPPYYSYVSTIDSVVVIDSLNAGTYTVTVTDMGSCGGGSQFIELTSPPALKVDAVPTEQPNGSYFSCDSCADGTVTAAALNGTAPYVYEWSMLPTGTAVMRIEGASLYVDDLSLLLGPDAPPPAVVSSTASLSGAAPSTWYAVMATDQLGCTGGKALSLEGLNDGSAPAWRLGGNTGFGNWLGTNDSTDVVMKVNNQEIFKLRADWVTEVMGDLKIGGLGGTFNPCEILTRGPDGIITATSGPCPPPPECTAEIPWSRAPDGNPVNIALCNAYQNVGIGYINPEHRLHVNGTGYFSQRVLINEQNPISSIELQVGGIAHIDKLRVNTETGSARLTVKATAGSQNSALEVQDGNGNAALEVSSDGIVTVGAPLTQTGDEAAIYFGDQNHYVKSVFGGGLRLGTLGSSDALIIEEGNGQVGIGTETPDAMLDVENNGTAAHTIVSRVSSTSTNAIEVFRDGTKEFIVRGDGFVYAREVNVQITALPDYVFNEDYNLPCLSDIETYVKENRHLPEVPSAKEVAQNGMNVGEMNAALLKKVEELTLYLIDQDKRLKLLQQQVVGLRNQ